MKKTIPALLFSGILALTACGNLDKGKKGFTLTFTSHKAGETVDTSLPLRMKGKVEGYKSLSDEQRKNLHLYLVEQSTPERRWHIEPAAVISPDGDWTAVTWLGNRHQGNGSTFHVCLVALDKALKLRNGDHPVKEKPKGMAEVCIDLVRRDR